MQEKHIAVVIILIILPGFIAVYPNFGSTTSGDVQFPEIPDNKIFPADTNQLLANAPQVFTENRGQLENDDIKFYAQGSGIWFTDDGVWFELREEISIDSRESSVESQESDELFDPLSRFEPPEPVKYKSVVLKQEFVGVNQVRPVGRDRLSWNSNFFYGNDSSKWRTEVPNYREIFFENLYDGIDLRYYTNNKGLKYDFLLHPGANINQIMVRYEGAKDLELDNFGNLIIKTPFENIIDGDLYIYQYYNGTKHHIDGNFVIKNDQEYGFRILQDYNKVEILVIDPRVRLDYSTFIGGGGNDRSFSIKVDAAGNAFVTGATLSSDFPTTPGVYNETFSGIWDIFIFKLDKNSSALLYSTFIGGSKEEESLGIAIDSKGNAYSTGITMSSDFPTTPGSYDTSYNDPPEGWGDVFAFKLNHNGSNLIYSTFIGDSEREEGRDIEVDSNGNAFITGYTASSSFPTTPGAYDTFYNGGSLDAFMLKLNQSGSGLYYSTFVGGDDGDWAEGIAIDSTGNIFVTGKIESTNFPTTPGAYNRLYNGGLDDCFVFKLNQNGSALIYSTFIGGLDREIGISIELDSNVNTLVTGWTQSTNFPTTPKAYDRTYNGAGDIFVLKLNPTGSTLVYSTFVGGNDFDTGAAIAIDSIGNTFVTGHTQSMDFPTTQDAYNNTYSNNLDVFMLELGPDGSTLLYSTYLGGSSIDWSYDITVDLIGDAYLTGWTYSPDFPTTPGAYNRTSSGVEDGFVVKFAFHPSVNITSLSLLMNNTPITIIYSQLCTYTFRINITDTVSLADLGFVRLILDTLGTNIQLSWDRSTGKFSKLSDPNNYVYIDPSSKGYNYFYFWTIDFNITFNWNYPDENFNDVQAYATSAALAPTWLNATELYRVENDLVFNGKLKVEGTDNRTITDGGLVRGGEKLNWTGLKVVYENTTDVYPPDDEVNITIWDEAGNSWSDSPPAGENFTIQTLTSPETDLDGDTHIVNLSGIPPECDKTNVTFTFRIDGDNVTFSNPTPDNTTWQTESTFVTVGVTITDIGGGEVKGSSVKHSYSTDNGNNWSDWEGIIGLKPGSSITPQDLIFLEEGTNNLIKWQAEDSVGNGPVVSDEYRILIDTEGVRFSNASPSADYESPTEEVEVGITISDVISGVDASTIEYAVSIDDGAQWSSWMSVPGLEDGTSINVTLNLTFPDGTGNRIKWRASDIAGNGPTESMIYTIKVNTWLQTLIPRVKLWSPPNGSIIPTTSVELIWRLENQNLLNVTYDVYLDTVTPPNATKETGLMNTSLLITDLSDGETYYWTVIPNVGMAEGWCMSSIWTFSVDTSVPVPSVTLLSPENGSMISSIKPTLSWSVEYEGSEIISYDVYLDTNRAPVEYEKCLNLYFLPQSILEDNKTYFWKVVPWAGAVRGPESETWSFTVNRDYIPRIELKLTVNPPYLEQLPGDVVSVQATVYNLGELTDTISLSVDIPADAEIIAVVNDPGTMDASPDGTAEFNITVTIAEDAKKGEVVLTVLAVSGKTAEYNLEIKENAELTVKIFGIDKPEDQGSSFLFTFLNILLIIIIIIIILVLVIIVNNRRKRDKEKKPTKEAVSVKPSEVPTAEISMGQAPTVAQLPGSAAGNVGEQSPGSTSSIPVLASSPSAAQTPAAQQIPQVVKLPQLPPAQSKIKESEASETTPENAKATPQPTLASQIQSEADAAGGSTKK